MDEHESTDSIASRSKVLFTIHRCDLSEAIDDRRYFIQRRDQLSEKLNMGILVLNGGSLVALLGLLGGDGHAAQWLGFTPAISLFSAVAFVVGLALAGHALNERELHYIQEASDANSRSKLLRRLVALGEAPMEPESHEEYGEVLQESHKLPLVGFQWSKNSTFARHWAGGAWLSGVLAPLMMSIGPKLWPIIWTCISS